MTRRWIVLFCALSFATATPTMAQAAPWNTVDPDTEELTYDDLVNELSRKKRQVRATPTADPFDTVKIHAGLGSVSSFSTFVINGQSVSRYQNGMQIAVGVDLFSDVWFSEAAWRNFGETHVGSEQHMLRELDLKIGYRGKLEGPWAYRLQSGLAQRHLRLDDTIRNIRIDETMPGVFFGAGATASVSPVVSVNFDVTGRTPVIGQTVDKGSVDFNLELKLSL